MVQLQQLVWNILFKPLTTWKWGKILFWHHLGCHIEYLKQGVISQTLKWQCLGYKNQSTNYFEPYFQFPIKICYIFAGLIMKFKSIKNVSLICQKHSTFAVLNSYFTKTIMLIKCILLYFINLSANHTWPVPQVFYQ